MDFTRRLAQEQQARKHSKEQLRKPNLILKPGLNDLDQLLSFNYFVVDNKKNPVREPSHRQKNCKKEQWARNQFLCKKESYFGCR